MVQVVQFSFSSRFPRLFLGPSSDIIFKNVTFLFEKLTRDSRDTKIRMCSVNSRSLEG